MGDERPTFVRAERGPLDFIVPALTLASVGVALAASSTDERPHWTGLGAAAVLIGIAVIGAWTRWYRIDEAPTVEPTATILDRAASARPHRWRRLVGETLGAPTVGLVLQLLGVDHAVWGCLVFGFAYLLASAAGEVVLRVTMRRRGVVFVRPHGTPERGFRTLPSPARS